MANNGPISVSAPGKSLNGAVGKDLTFRTKYPFAKLDSTNPVSFQNITLFFNVDTPNPDGTILKYKRTQVYSFAHGYNYVPATWFLVANQSISNPSYFSAVAGTEGVFILGSGNFATRSAAAFIAIVDSTNVTFYIDKYYDPSIVDLGVPNIIGYYLTIRSYVFVNDLTGTDVPTQA